MRWYITEVTDTYTLKTASFKGLLPGGQYLLLALEDGTLVFTYVQRETVNVSYVVACGVTWTATAVSTTTTQD